jgi:hypothetical protein
MVTYREIGVSYLRHCGDPFRDERLGPGDLLGQLVQLLGTDLPAQGFDPPSQFDGVANG